MGAQAASTLGSAEGDSYGAYVTASLLGSNSPLTVGPIAASTAVVPPGTSAFNQTGLVTAGPSAPINPLLSALNVTNDTSKATFAPAAYCQPNQAPGDLNGFTGALSGGEACSTIANAELLNTGTLVLPTPQITATAIFAQSVTDQCDPADGMPFGSANVLTLTIGGQDLTSTINTKRDNKGQIPPNTVIPVVGPGPNNIITVILNEQKLDNISGGQGLTVNAIHVFTGPAIAQLAVVDAVIGHTHSSAICTTPPGTQACPPGSKDPKCVGDIITKTDDTGSETAAPGQTITYSLSIDTTTNAGANVNCVTTQVTDILPPGFTYVPGSASGDLGTSPVLGSSGSRQTLTFFSATGFGGKSPLTETLSAKIPDNEAAGPTLSNFVDTESSCGENTGSSPGITIVVPGTTTGGTQGANTGGTLGAATGTGGLVNTSAAAPLGRIWLGMGLLGLGASVFVGSMLLRARRIS